METALEVGPRPLAPSRHSWLARVTVEQAVYAGLVALAAVLRLSALNAAPLSPDEAVEALGVWTLSLPRVLSGPAGSPAYFSLSGLLVQVAGYSDATMRLIPALFGLATVGLPYFLRHRIGRPGALFAAFVLATSPTLAFASRTAGGAAIATFAGLLLLVAGLRFAESGRAAWLGAGAGALALGLTSAPLFHSMAVALAAAWLLHARVGPALLADGGEDLQWRRPDRNELRAAAGLFALLFGLLASGFFVAPGGLGAAVSLLGEWVVSLGLPSALDAWLSPILSLGRYELMVLVVAVPAVLIAAWQGRPWVTFLVLWMVASMGIILLQPGEAANALTFVIPAALLAGGLVSDLLDGDAGAERWAVAAVVAAGGAIVIANLARFSRLEGSATVDADPAAYHRYLILIVVAVVIMLAGTVWSWNPAAGRQGALLGLIALLGAYAWGTAWWLTHGGAADARERWVAEATDPDLPRMVANLYEISWSLTGGPADLEIVSEVDNPALRWYLRDFRAARFESIGPGISAQAGLISAADRDPFVADAYTGTEFRVLRSAGDMTLDSVGLIRWWLFHDAPASGEVQRAILWLPARLVQAIP